ncbi:MAG: DUF4956 domain-containing protein [Verrucomicrobiota bacterium]|nr:DUF4956 domain-containing protein [Verrucomicrobiota bacterium]
MELVFNALGPSRALDPRHMLVSLCVSFLLGSMLAAIYRRTHSGFSYSRSFVQTIVLGCLVSTVMIIVIGNNLARGLGIMGALAIVRFRTPIRDPRDIIFVFASLAMGIASGAQLYFLGVIGTLFFCGTVLFLNYSPFTSKREFEGMLRFLVPPQSLSINKINSIIPRFVITAELIAVREAIQGEALEYSYQVCFRDPSGKTDLVEELGRLGDVVDISLVMNRATVEI